MKMLSMNEGNTPLIKFAKIPYFMMANVDISMKNEGKNPNGSIYDRGIFCSVGRALERYSEGIIAYSEGENALSIASYSARLGLKSYILVPEEKFRMENFIEILGFETKIIVVKDSTEKVINMAMDISSNYPILWASDFRNEDFIKGMKTIVTEIPQDTNKIYIHVNKAWKMELYGRIFGDTSFKLCFVTEKNALESDNVTLINNYELEEGDNLLKKHEGIVTNRAMSMIMAGIIKHDRAGMLADGEKIIILVDNMGIKSFYPKETGEHIVRMGGEIEALKNLIGLK